MSANLDEANRAKEKALEFIRQKEYGQALKYLRISNRMHPSHDTEELIQSAQSQYNDANSTSSHVETGSNNSSSNIRSRVLEQASFLQQFRQSCFENYNIMVGFIERLERKYIIEAYRPYVKGMVVVAIGLLFIRLFLRKKLKFGELPGDIYYSSSNVMVSAPLVSCALVSFIVNAGLSLFNRRARTV